MSRFLDQIRKAKQAREETLKSSAAPGKPVPKSVRSAPEKTLVPETPAPPPPAPKPPQSAPRAENLFPGELEKTRFDKIDKESPPKPAKAPANLYPDELSPEKPQEKKDDPAEGESEWPATNGILTNGDANGDTEEDGGEQEAIPSHGDFSIDLEKLFQEEPEDAGEFPTDEELEERNAPLIEAVAMESGEEPQNAFADLEIDMIAEVQAESAGTDDKKPEIYEEETPEEKPFQPDTIFQMPLIKVDEIEEEAEEAELLQASRQEEEGPEENVPEVSFAAFEAEVLEEIKSSEAEPDRTEPDAPMTGSFDLITELTGATQPDFEAPTESEPEPVLAAFEAEAEESKDSERIASLSEAEELDEVAEAAPELTGAALAAYAAATPPVEPTSFTADPEPVAPVSPQKTKSEILKELKEIQAMAEPVSHKAEAPKPRPEPIAKKPEPPEETVLVSATEADAPEDEDEERQEAPIAAPKRAEVQEKPRPEPVAAVSARQSPVEAPAKPAASKGAAPKRPAVEPARIGPKRSKPERLKVPLAASLFPSELESAVMSDEGAEEEYQPQEPPSVLFRSAAPAEADSGRRRRSRMPKGETPIPGPELSKEFVNRIARVIPKPDKRVLSYYEPKHHICEEYRLLGKNLLHSFANGSDDMRRGKVVALSSSVRGEGKTLTSMNLALTLSQDLTDRVLLVDGDLRHPKIHRYVGLPPSSGLNDLLASDRPEEILEDSLLRTDTGLHLLLSQSTRGNPAPLLDSPNMTRILDLLRDRYSIIILDTPPVLLATDALTLGARSDGMLFLFRARKTQREQIQEARQRIARLDIRLLGYVINNVKSFLPKIWSRYYYGNY